MLLAKRKFVDLGSLNMAFFPSEAWREDEENHRHGIVTVETFSAWHNHDGFLLYIEEQSIPYHTIPYRTNHRPHQRKRKLRYNNMVWFLVPFMVEYCSTRNHTRENYFFAQAHQFQILCDDIIRLNKSCARFDMITNKVFGFSWRLLPCSYGTRSLFYFVSSSFSRCPAPPPKLSSLNQ